MADDNVKYECLWDITKHEGKPCPIHHLKSDENGNLFASKDAGQSYDPVSKEDYELLKDAGYSEDGVDLNEMDIKIIQETERGKNEAEEHEFYITIDGKKIGDIFYTPESARKGLKKLLNDTFDINLTDEDIDDAVGIIKK